MASVASEVKEFGPDSLLGFVVLAVLAALAAVVVLPAVDWVFAKTTQAAGKLIAMPRAA